MRTRLVLIALLAILFACSLDPNQAPQTEAAPGDIATYAGGGVGDGSPPLNAAISPAGIASDAAGNVYIADAVHCRVRKLTPGGVISTVVGIGACGIAGDGGPATSARLDLPLAVAVSAGGELLIADTANCRVRHVSAGGTISTLAGNGVCIYGGDGGPAASAFLAEPEGVAFAPGGDVYIADTGNCRVRKISAGVMSTFAGTGACGFGGDGGPATSAGIGRASGVTVDAVGNVYIADTTSCRVRVVSTAGIISTLAGNGTCGYTGDGVAAYATALNRPRAVAFDAAGNLLIADTDNCRIRSVGFPAVLISTVAGDGTCNVGGDGGPATAGKLKAPRGIAVTATGIHIADYGNCRMRLVSAGVITTSAGTGWCHFGGDGGPATNAALSTIGDVAADSSGNIYIADTANCRVRKVDTGGTITTLAGTGVCAFSGDGGAATSAALNSPQGVAVDASGAVYIADSGNCRIRRVMTGVISTFAGSGACAYGGDGASATAAALAYPQAVAVYASTVYIADTFNCRIRRVVGGVITTVAGNGSCTYGGDDGPPAAASLTFPYDVAADASAVYIADTYNCRVRKVAANVISTIAGTGACTYGGDGGPATFAGLDQPSGIAILGSALYVADKENCRVRLLAAETIISSTGTGFCEYGGDGAAAVDARLNLPSGVAAGPTGAIYIADSANRRVRLLSPGADGDSDGVPDANDNCAAVANPSQANNDRNFIDMGPLPADDLTRPASDTSGDACDPDDDNDGLVDLSEPAGCNGSGPLNPLLADTDGDRSIDNAECLLGSNPGSSASVPAHIVAPDADNDGVPDAFDPNDASVDSDGDKVQDRSEFRHYGTNLASANSDGDVCADGKEVASINGDNVVNVADLGTTASRFGSSATPQYLVQLDANKDGTINVADMGIVANNFGAC